MVFDLAGNELGRWAGAWDISMTPDGPAAVSVEKADCLAIEVEHPRFETNLPCTATELRWSPDGRFLAYQLVAPSSEIRIVDLDTGDVRAYPTEHPSRSIEWNHDGSRLVVRFGGGL